MILTAGAAVPVAPEAFDVALAANAVSVDAMSSQSVVQLGDYEEETKARGTRVSMQRITVADEVLVPHLEVCSHESTHQRKHGPARHSTPSPSNRHSR